ncbi:PelD GGDEF domain-containing protein [Ferrigenium sp. UT5]|uniref:PelD GGDEF domain-containing protein n=1 Tax=Ferrigenium sp. UT5 TaxID=3242105 RepID=UPI0035510A5B
MLAGSDKFIEHFHRLVAPLRQHRLAWLETVAITLGAVAAGIFFQHDNPFQVRGEFPWVWLAPVLVALRYGVAPGFISSLLLIAIWKWMDYSAESHAAFPEQFFLGGLILVLVCGEFSAAWSARLRRAEETNRYLDARLSRITSRHLLLRLSHDRMEQEMLLKPATLRQALGNLRQLALQRDDTSMPASDVLLQLLAQYCQLVSAAIYVPIERGYVCVSRVGEPPALRETDPLLRHALEHQSLSHLQVEDVTNETLASPFVVVAPILSSSRRLQGILAIERMPFLALNEENLHMLSVMLGYYADCVDEAEGVRQFKAMLPEAPPDFAAEFPRLLRLQRDFGIDSYIVALPFSNDERGRQVVAGLTQVRRGLDIAWQVIVGERIWNVNLMPLTSAAAVEGYLLRIENMLREYGAVVHEEWTLTPIRIGLDQADPLATLHQLLEPSHA